MQPTEERRRPRPLGSTKEPAVLWALVLDTVCVFVLAVGGRASHSESLTVGEVVNTALPFLVGAYLVHLLAVRYFDPLAPFTSGLAVAAGSWAVGMVGRLMVGSTNAPAFMLVAAGVLLVTMLGWRLVALALRKGRNNTRR